MTSALREEYTIKNYFFKSHNMSEVNLAGQPAQLIQREGAVPVPPEVAVAGAVIETGAQKAEDARLLVAEQLGKQSPLVQELTETRKDGGGYSPDAINGAIILAQKVDAHRNYIPFAPATDCPIVIGILDNLGLPSIQDTKIHVALRDEGLAGAIAERMSVGNILGMTQALAQEGSRLAQLDKGMELLLKRIADNPAYKYEYGLIKAMADSGKLREAIGIERALSSLLQQIQEKVQARQRQQPPTTAESVV